MKRCLLSLIVLLFSIVIAQATEDKNNLLGDKIISVPESTQLTDSINKTKTLTNVLRTGWTSGYYKGLYDGSKKSQKGWFWSSCASGAVTSCVGGGILWLVAKNTEDTPHLMPNGDQKYQAGYLKGYKESAKSERASSAFQGCLIGSAINAVAVIGLCLFFSQFYYND